MSLTYLHAPADTWQDFGGYDDKWEDFFDAVRAARNLVIGPNAVSVAPPDDTVWIGETKFHKGSGFYWQLGLKKEVVSYKDRTGATNQVLNLVVTATQINGLGDKIRTEELRHTQPTITPTDASGLVAVDQKFRNVTNFASGSYRANELGLGTYESEPGVFDAPRVRNSMCDTLMQAGFPPYGYVGDAEGPIHGAVIVGDWLVSQISNANGWVALNVETFETYERLGWGNEPSAAVAFEPLTHSPQNYPWDSVGNIFDPGWDWSRDLCNVIGELRPGTLLVQYERQHFKGQFTSDFDRDYDWSYTTSPYLDPQDPGSGGASNGDAGSSSFGAKWINGMGQYGAVTVVDALGIGEDEYGICTPSAGAPELISDCGTMPCHPRRSYGFNTSAPVPDPIASYSEVTAAAAINLIFSEMRADLQLALDQARFINFVCYKTEIRWEEVQVGTWDLLGTRYGPETWSPGTEIVRGQSLALFREGGSMASLNIEPYPEEFGFENFYRLVRETVPGYISHDPSALPLKEGRGEFVHYCTGPGSFVIDGEDRVIDEDVGAGDRTEFAAFSADSGACGPPEAPDGPYLYVDGGSPGSHPIYDGNFYWHSTRIFAKLAPESPVVHSLPTDCHSGKYACDGEFWIAVPREETGDPDGFPLRHVGTEDPDWHNEECERLHQIVCRKYTKSFSGPGNWDEIAWSVPTGPLVGVGLADGREVEQHCRHGDCRSTLKISGGYFYCVLFGKNGYFLISIAVRENGAHKAGEVASVTPVPTLDHDQEFTHNNIVVINRRPHLFDGSGFFELREAA